MQRNGRTTNRRHEALALCAFRPLSNETPSGKMCEAACGPQILQSSSPSYVLMASLDAARLQIDQQARVVKEPRDDGMIYKDAAADPCL